MKKRILFLLAAMLLTSVCTNAQDYNYNPARGDVNNDGIIDVADIVAVIDIMKNGGGTETVNYFYIGTTLPTATNYKTLQGVVTSYSSINDATDSNVSVAAGETLYILFPTAWTTEKSIALKDELGTIIILEEKDVTTIPNYIIYKTPTWENNNNVTFKTLPDNIYDASNLIATWSPPAGGLKKTYSDSNYFNTNKGDILILKCEGTISPGSSVAVSLHMNGTTKELLSYTTPNSKFTETSYVEIPKDGNCNISYTYKHNGGGTAYSIKIYAYLLSQSNEDYK